MITCSTLFQKDDVGKYILIDGKWLKISEVYSDLRQAVVSESLTATGVSDCIIGVMNELVITTQNSSVSSIEISYAGRVR